MLVTETRGREISEFAQIGVGDMCAPALHPLYAKR